MNYLICRASDITAGKQTLCVKLKFFSFILKGRCWMDALELTMKCSKLLKKPYSSTTNEDLPSSSQSSSNPAILTPNNIADNSCLSTSFSDTEFELSRLSAKEGSIRVEIQVFILLNGLFFFCL